MGIHNISLYKEVDKKYTGCNLKTTELLDCTLIGVCAVIRSNTVIRIPPLTMLCLRGSKILKVKCIFTKLVKHEIKVVVKYP